MGRAPCCEKDSVKRGPWTPEEDAKLLACVAQHGTGSWRTLPKKAGLQRCGKSCRLRWTNYLRPDLKHGRFSEHEEQTIVKLHAALGSRWSLIAAQLPGRTDNDVKNYWNTRLKKKLCEMGIDPITHKPISQLLADLAGSMGTMTPSGQPSGATSATAPSGRTIADAALGCFKDDMLNVIMRRHPNSNIMSTATASGLSMTAASCTSSPTATNGALERPSLLNTPQFLQINSAFRRQLPFALSQGAVGGGQSMIGGGLQGMGGGVIGGSSPKQPSGILPPYLNFLNPTSAPSSCTSLSPFLPSTSQLHITGSQDEQQPAKSLMDMLLDANANHTISSSSSTLISGMMPSCFNRGMNEGTSSMTVQLGTATSVHVETQSTISIDTDKFLASQADFQAHIAEPNPWFNTQEEEEEEEEEEREERHPQDNLEEQDNVSSLLRDTQMFNWAPEASSLASAHGKSSRGDANNMLAWSPTCTSRSSSTSSNFPGPSEATHIPSHSIIDQSPLTSVDAMLWDLADLHTFIS